MRFYYIFGILGYRGREAITRWYIYLQLTNHACACMKTLLMLRTIKIEISKKKFQIISLKIFDLNENPLRYIARLPRFSSCQNFGNFHINLRILVKTVEHTGKIKQMGWQRTNKINFKEDISNRKWYLFCFSLHVCVLCRRDYDGGSGVFYNAYSANPASVGARSIWN